jgi:hypothetical protein
MLQPKIIKVKALPDYKLFLEYETGEKKIFDVTPYIEGDWFGKLRDIKIFNNVRIAGLSVEWADGRLINQVCKWE